MIIQLTAIVSYMIAIAIANVLVTTYGHNALPFTAFVIIPFDMTARNVLHEVWRGNYLILKMGSLIVCGSVVSYLLGGASASVAVASCCSFFLAGIADSIVYQVLFDTKPMTKMNTSNGVAAIVDSIAFPLIAFGSLSLPIMVAQATMKFVGGFLWSIWAKRLVQKVAT